MSYNFQNTLSTKLMFFEKKKNSLVFMGKKSRELNIGRIQNLQPYQTYFSSYWFSHTMKPKYHLTISPVPTL